MSAQAVHTIPNLNGAVTGIALLKDRLYFSHRGIAHLALLLLPTFQSLGYIDCYCPTCRNQSGILQCNCYQKANQQVAELQHIVACNIKNCIYVALQKLHVGNYICKVALDQNNTLSSWSVAGIPWGLSITSSHNVLAAFCNVNSLHEYTPDGQLIREINLQPAGISNVWYCVQLSNDQFGVTHHRPKNQFSIVSSDGQLVKSYPGNAREMNWPQGIAVDERGRILVADQTNNRILVMDSKTLEAYPLQLPTDSELKAPYCIHFDAASRRLYIGEWNASRIVCCQL